MTPIAPAVEIKDLTRVFGTKNAPTVALNRVSLSIPRGQCLALLGHNGAGKSTLIKIIGTMLLPTSGEVYVEGVDVQKNKKEARRLVSVVLGGDRGLYSMLTGRENLQYFAMLAGVARSQVSRAVPEMLEQVGLHEAADRRVETYSKGMKQRLHIAAGLIGRPQVLLLDEPTVGLDPNEAENLRSYVGQLRSSGVTILLTSHYLLDVERLADRVVMINRGVVTHDLSLPEFSAIGGYTAAIDVTMSSLHAATALAALPPLHGVEVSTITTDEAGLTKMTILIKRWYPELLEKVGEVLSPSGVVAMNVRGTGLEDAFAAASRA